MTAPPTLTFISADKKHILTEKFSEGYATQSGDGVYDIVLVSTGLKPTEVSGSGSLLAPSYSLPLKQTVHMRIFWRPVRGSKPTSCGCATNTVIHWVLQSQSQPTDQPPTDILEYNGTGFVRVSPVQKNRAFEMRIVSATIEPGSKIGNLSDPLGPANLYGLIEVKSDDAKVKAVLADLA